MPVAPTPRNNFIDKLPGKAVDVSADAADVRLKDGSKKKAKKPRFVMILAGAKK